MSKSSTAAKIQEHLHSPFVAILAEYVKTRNPELIPTMPAEAGWRVCHEIILPAIAEHGTTPESEAVIAVISLRIKNDPVNTKDDFARGFFSGILPGSHQYEFHPYANRAQEGFLRIAEEVELSRSDLAKNLLLNYGHLLTFGWKEDETDRVNRVMGWGCDAAAFFLLPPQSIEVLTPIEEFLWSFNDDALVAVLADHHAGYLHGTLARFRPESFARLLQSLETNEQRTGSIGWKFVLTASNLFDQECIKFCGSMTDPTEKLHALIFLSEHRELAHHDLALAACKSIDGNLGTVLIYLSRVDPKELIPILDSAIRSDMSMDQCRLHLQVLSGIFRRGWKPLARGRPGPLLMRSSRSVPPSQNQNTQGVTGGRSQRLTDF
ncbi:MAG: hypothetical protein R3F19_35400 [Verrucomicrobiales bacterium]